MTIFLTAVAVLAAMTAPPAATLTETGEMWYVAARDKAGVTYRVGLRKNAGAVIAVLESFGPDGKSGAGNLVDDWFWPDSPSTPSRDWVGKLDLGRQIQLGFADFSYGTSDLFGPNALRFPVSWPSQGGSGIGGSYEGSPVTGWHWDEKRGALQTSVRLVNFYDRAHGNPLHLEGHPAGLTETHVVTESVAPKFLVNLDQTVRWVEPGVLEITQRITNPTDKPVAARGRGLFGHQIPFLSLNAVRPSPGGSFTPWLQYVVADLAPGKTELPFPFGDWKGGAVGPTWLPYFRGGPLHPRFPLLTPDQTGGWVGVTDRAGNGLAFVCGTTTNRKIRGSDSRLALWNRAGDVTRPYPEAWDANAFEIWMYERNLDLEPRESWNHRFYLVLGDKARLFRLGRKYVPRAYLKLAPQQSPLKK